MVGVEEATESISRKERTWNLFQKQNLEHTANHHMKPWTQLTLVKDMSYMHTHRKTHTQKDPVLL